MELVAPVHDGLTRSGAFVLRGNGKVTPAQVRTRSPTSGSGVFAKRG